MTKEEFRKITKEKFVFLDGATGTNLMNAGMPAGVCPEEWILGHKQVFIDLQKSYVNAGSDILYAPTFTANRIKLAEYGLDNQTKEINEQLVALSKTAAQGKAMVAGDLTMTGKQLKPVGDLYLDELIEVYKEQIGILIESGVDLLIIETMMSLQECRAALIAYKEYYEEQNVAGHDIAEEHQIPVMVTLTFESDGKTLFGTDAATAAICLEALGADAVGANCSTGPDQMADIIRAMTGVTTIPIIAKPNAGLPSIDKEGNTFYDLEPEGFGEQMQLLVDSGATIIGGCCGTDHRYIEAIVSRFGSLDPKTIDLPRKDITKRYLSSERSHLIFGLDDRFMIIGERINPTGKKKLQAMLREGDMEGVSQLAISQEENGAAILDVNVGMGGIDELSVMENVLTEVSVASTLPLCIDSSDCAVLERALRLYPGRALINSISLEKGKAQMMLPIAKKYGAMFILLPVGEEGLPKDTAEKIDNIEKLSNMAMEYGLGKTDIIVDGLVATVGADPSSAKNVIEIVSWCKENGYATVCGLSNISFGLPQRAFVNTAFLTMAIMSGLTMAIANPSQELLVNAAFASDLLMNKTASDIRYIERMQRYDHNVTLDSSTQSNGSKPTDNAQTQVAVTPLDQLKTDVLKGNKKSIEKNAKDALDQGISAEDILNDALMPAINEVGELFDQGKYFLPQLIAGAEAMKNAIAVIEPYMARDEDSDKPKPTVIIATVKGDIHDIGKNLVALMLSNYGFNVIDLGKDVPRELIIETAIEKGAKVVALSALMTTTMAEMKNVIELAREKYPELKVIIGGAAVTPEYADEIGADGYSSDAADCVALVRRLLNITD